MTSLEKCHCGQQGSMQGHQKHSDGFSDCSSIGSFIDETDREVSSLTDRAFRSLCIGEEAIYNDVDVSTSPIVSQSFKAENNSISKNMAHQTLSLRFQQYGDFRDFMSKSATTFRESFTANAEHLQELQAMSLNQSNGMEEISCQQRQSSSRVSSLIKAFSSGEVLADGGIFTEAIATKDKYGSVKSQSLDRSALQSIQKELSEFSVYQNFKSQSFHPPRKKNQTSNEAGAVTQMGFTTSLMRPSKSGRFQSLNSNNFFLHSEFSPFQMWKDYSRFAFETHNISRAASSSDFHQWYNSPIYKEVLTTPPLQRSPYESMRSHTKPVENMINEVQCSRSLVMHKALAIEKRSESELASNGPLLRQNNHQTRRNLPASRPATASPISVRKRYPDSILFSTMGALHNVHKFHDGQTHHLQTPFNITQLLTPVLPIKQSTETSKAINESISTNTSSVAWHREAKQEPAVEITQQINSYKLRASKLLFNVKDNRKRVKSTYSPNTFRGNEITDYSKQSSKLESLEHKKSDSFSEISVQRMCLQEYPHDTLYPNIPTSHMQTTSTTLHQIYCNDGQSQGKCPDLLPQQENVLQNSPSNSPLHPDVLSMKTENGICGTQLSSTASTADHQANPHALSYTNTQNTLMHDYHYYHNTAAKIDAQLNEQSTDSSSCDTAGQEHTKKQQNVSKGREVLSVNDKSNKAVSLGIRGEIAALIEKDRQKKIDLEKTQNQQLEEGRHRNVLKNKDKHSYTGSLNFHSHSQQRASPINMFTKNIYEQPENNQKLPFSIKEIGNNEIITSTTFDQANKVIHPGRNTPFSTSDIKNRSSIPDKSHAPVSLKNEQYTFNQKKQWCMVPPHQINLNDDEPKMSYTKQRTQTTYECITSHMISPEMEHNNKHNTSEDKVTVHYEREKHPFSVKQEPSQTYVTNDKYSLQPVEEELLNINDIRGKELMRRECFKENKHGFTDVIQTNEPGENAAEMGKNKTVKDYKVISKKEIRQEISDKTDLIVPKGHGSALPVMFKDGEKICRAPSLRTQSKQEILTLRVKAHAQKEISALKERGFSLKYDPRSSPIGEPLKQRKTERFPAKLNHTQCKDVHKNKEHTKNPHNKEETVLSTSNQSVLQDRDAVTGGDASPSPKVRAPDKRPTRNEKEHTNSKIGADMVSTKPFREETDAASKALLDVRSTQKADENITVTDLTSSWNTITAVFCSDKQQSSKGFKTFMNDNTENSHQESPKFLMNICEGQPIDMKKRTKRPKANEHASKNAKHCEAREGLCVSAANCKGGTSKEGPNVLTNINSKNKLQTCSLDWKKIPADHNEFNNMQSDKIEATNVEELNEALTPVLNIYSEPNDIELKMDLQKHKITTDKNSGTKLPLGSSTEDSTLKEGIIYTKKEYYLNDISAENKLKMSSGNKMSDETESVKQGLRQLFSDPTRVCVEKTNVKKCSNDYEIVQKDPILQESGRYDKTTKRQEEPHKHNEKIGSNNTTETDESGYFFEIQSIVQVQVQENEDVKGLKGNVTVEDALGTLHADAMGTEKENHIDDVSEKAFPITVEPTMNDSLKHWMQSVKPGPTAATCTDNICPLENGSSLNMQISNEHVTTNHILREHQSNNQRHIVENKMEQPTPELLYEERQHQAGPKPFSQHSGVSNENDVVWKEEWKRQGKTAVQGNQDVSVALENPLTENKKVIKNYAPISSDITATAKVLALQEPQNQETHCNRESAAQRNTVKEKRMFYRNNDTDHAAKHRSDTQDICKMITDRKEKPVPMGKSKNWFSVNNKEKKSERFENSSEIGECSTLRETMENQSGESIHPKVKESPQSPSQNELRKNTESHVSEPVRKSSRCKEGFTRHEISALADYARLKVLPECDDGHILNNLHYTNTQIFYANSKQNDSFRQIADFDKLQRSRTTSKPDFQSEQVPLSPSISRAMLIDHVISMNHTSPSTKEAVQHSGGQGGQISHSPYRPLPLQVEGQSRDLSLFSQLSQNSSQESEMTQLLVEKNHESIDSNCEVDKDDLQYYIVNNTDTDKQSNQITYRNRSVHKPKPSSRPRKNEMDLTQKHINYKMSQPLCAPCSSPALGTLSMFREKENTSMATSLIKIPRTKFHGSCLQGDARERSQELEEKNESGELLTQHEPVLHCLPHAKDMVSDNASSEKHSLIMVPQSHSRQDMGIDNDKTHSGISIYFKDVDKCMPSIMGGNDDMSERPMSSCSFSDRASSKPPAVPPKTEKALRRAKHLTFRKIKKEETLMTMNNMARLEATPIRAVSSMPSSPSQLLPMHHSYGPIVPHTAQYHFGDGYGPGAQSIPMTQRKLLQDPCSGQYFMVDMPLHLKTKMFFDPITSKYVCLSVRQPAERVLSLSQTADVVKQRYILYPGFLPISVCSLPPARSSSQMSAPASLMKEQEKTEATSAPWSPEVNYQTRSTMAREYPGPETQYRNDEEKVDQRHLDIITMSELEDFAMESV
ncbi:cardiac-enriched FHL2-interacting protein [Denticeps clupeoides]|uniref:DUF4585 domain-containing protein n=1 Tax=Denticeps clupeoides TaxID=299321 RepID=A0AAY4E1I9_9TELE|nr:cardiac-enriched FHL2-interacting protein [Denticeps clupeoides]XP_028826193.1 cardiac-enriched FHL2-interacting protein [Denticeps clupeoides]